MTKPFPLQTLVNLAEHHNESAIRKLGQLNALQQSAQQQLDTLLEFRRDYQAQLQKGIQEGMNSAELRNFQQFIGKLDEAIAQQRRQVENSKLSTEAGRAEFDMTRRKLQSLDMLKQRHVKKQEDLANKAEQKELDEHSGRMAARRMGEKGNAPSDGNPEEAQARRLS